MMKIVQWALAILVAILTTAILILWLWGGEDWLQSIYLWIAELENSARGIDGITEASRVKVMGDATRHFGIIDKVCQVILIIILLFICIYGKRQMYKKKG